MRRQWLAWVGLAALGAVTASVVALALRPEPVSSPAAVPVDVGAVAVAGDSVVRWAGPAACNPDADGVDVERSTDGRRWQGSSIPLVNVDDLSFADERHGVAVGTTSDCNRGVALTADGGVTWTSSPRDPILLDAWYVDTTVWGVERRLDAPQIAAFTARLGGGLRPDQAATSSRPCSAADGALDQVAFWTPQRGLLLCQNSVASSLLVARTADAGASFEALADDRPELGLDSVSEVVDMAVAGERSVWMLFAPGGECSEGELRRSDSEGASFEPLPCPAESVDVDTVLDVSFSSDADGVMLALRDREPVLAVTTDGGATWSEHG